MDTANQFLTQDHRACDLLWAEVEAAADEGDLAATQQRFGQFAAVMERHFSFEETRLFPALEDATGMHGMGPTSVMRHEHAQMRRVLQSMADELAKGNTQGLLDHGDTLLMLVQQHNLKEEHILYPMADARLSAQWPAMRGLWPAV
jgi:iron-sulfur cluster repair protein YtfE (RIC family)